MTRKEVMALKLFKAIGLAIVFWGVYLVLVGTTTYQELLVGAIVSFIISYGVVELMLTWHGTKTTLGGILLFLFVYVPYFIYAMIKANIDVAYRVLHPSMPIDPAVVSFKTKLKSDLGKLILANSITLTPGTITLEVKGDEFFIHWIDAPVSDPEQAKEAICGTFERLLLRITG